MRVRLAGVVPVVCMSRGHRVRGQGSDAAQYREDVRLERHDATLAAPSGDGCVHRGNHGDVDGRRRELPHRSQPRDGQRGEPTEFVHARHRQRCVGESGTSRRGVARADSAERQRQRASRRSTSRESARLRRSLDERRAASAGERRLETACAAIRAWCGSGAHGRTFRWEPRAVSRSLIRDSHSFFAC